MAEVRAAVVAALIAGVAAPADAAIKDYQIIRLLTYKTDCQVGELKTLESTGGSLRFLATCTNVTFYPDGVEILCEEPDDDRSCHVLTHPQTFDHLRALERKE